MDIEFFIEEVTAVLCYIKCLAIHSAIDCSHGDVWLKDDGTPFIFSNFTWSPICGHYFWDNENGANLFCKKLGFENGTVYPKKYTPSRHQFRYSQDAFKVGKCNSGDSSITRCRGGCNDYRLGGRCSDNDEANCDQGQNVGIKITCGWKDGSYRTSIRSSCTSMFGI